VWRAAVLLLVVSSLAAGCGGSGGSTAAARTEVVAGFYPLAWAAQEVGGDAVDVTNLTPPGAEPHDLELSVRDVEAVRSADLVLYLGDFQPALADAAADTRGEALDLLDPGAADPHVWLDPARFAGLVERIGAALEAEPAAAELAGRLRALDEELAAGLAQCDRHELVTSHEAFGYLADRYGLEQLGVQGISPEAEPTPQALADVVALVRASGATTVFTEPLVSPRLAEAVARETGAETAVLDPLEGLDEAAIGRGEDYFSVMRANLAALRDALGCR
jgi:zinc transport system substrate-binding protein